MKQNRGSDDRTLLALAMMLYSAAAALCVAVVTVALLFYSERPHIVIRTNSASGEYGSGGVRCEGYTCNELPDSISASLDYTVKASDDMGVGKVLNNARVKTIKNPLGIDLDGFFRVDYVYGELELTPRTIVIASQTRKEQYSGTPISDTDYTVTEGSLRNGDYIYVYEFAVQKDIGTSENVIKVRIMRNGRDVSTNYIIKYRYGTLELTP